MTILILLSCESLYPVRVIILKQDPGHYFIIQDVILYKHLNRFTGCEIYFLFNPVLLIPTNSIIPFVGSASKC